MTPPDRVIFALRESPDWAALAADYAAGRSIESAGYARPRNIPSFPTNIVDLIERWNRFAAVPFFACRAELKAIAAATLAAVTGAETVSHADLAAYLATHPLANGLLFFCDDDDWFAPGLLAALPEIPAGTDAVVFPLARLAVESFTIARHHAHAETRVIDPIGPVHPFVLRYHTNNYALTAQALAKSAPETLIEHRQAAETADRLAFTDLHCPRIVAITSKTPCSASLLAAVVADAERFRRYVTHYLQNLKSLPIPVAHAWLRDPLWQTIRLFERTIRR